MVMNDMKHTVLVNQNGGVQIPATTRKALGIQPGDLIEIDVIRVAMTKQDLEKAKQKRERQWRLWKKKSLNS